MNTGITSIAALALTAATAGGVATSAATGPGDVAADAAIALDGNWHRGERCSTRVEERNLGLFEERLERLLGGDTAASREYFSDDAVVQVHGSVPFAGTYTVQDGAYESMRGEWFAPQPGAMTDLPTLYADCDQVVLIGQVVSTAVPTGRTLDTTVIEFFTYDANGKITRDDFYYADTTVVNAALTP
jgi:ketosteroid isomerase-like protein